jgi:hypothetical protein
VMLLTFSNKTGWRDQAAGLQGQCDIKTISLVYEAVCCVCNISTLVGAESK